MKPDMWVKKTCLEEIVPIVNASKYINEPAIDKTDKMLCAPSEDSDQPRHLPRLIRAFAVRSCVAKDQSFLHAHSED